MQVHENAQTSLAIVGLLVSRSNTSGSRFSGACQRTFPLGIVAYVSCNESMIRCIPKSVICTSPSILIRTLPYKTNYREEDDIGNI